ncbi:type ISP restriction/modification enzyme [Novosphingobium sp. 17-62-19]|uniref:type ISP restriction/modification enzyme n=1 Tax=Novosphingobium sp. 17-62-19 TaxID=1970406 RepID=UPI002600A5D3|nr:type ISP restriction/modification enzyme [Novosphingobium sp. 17-62-19]HQS96076.1 N-6 DNA methylase [Novosphingobium sp.]
MSQAESIKIAVGEFGASAKAKLNEGGQPEDQLRNPIEQLFAALSLVIGIPKGALTLIGEKSLSELRTRPDFAVNISKALIGFIEIKAPGKGADPRKWKTGHDKEQWDKLKALPNLLYSDGNAFSLWRDGALVGSIIKLDGDIEDAGAKLAAPEGFLPLLNDFLTWQPIAPRNVPELARISARLCRFLRDEVVEQLGIKNAKLTELKEDWKALLFPDADDAKFADGYAQAVTFGLLMAKSKGLSLADGLDDIAKELGKTNTLIGAALRLLTEQDLKLGPALDTLTRVLDVVDWGVIAKGDPEAWLYFYENFLEVYDNKLRKLTGSYYTPPEVVQAMVRLCDEALRSSDRFAVAQGLASAQVRIADPATGSGTFLLAALRAIAQSVGADEGEGAVPGAITEAAKRLYGFELQFGAFAVAQLRLLAEMIDLGADGSPGLFVTDTLSDPHADFESGQGIYREISKSQRLAGEIKRAQPITVVIGNPPYKEKAKGKGSWIENGRFKDGKDAPLNDWQPPKAWKVGTHAKHLRNLYVYFWRWAAWKVFEQGAGGRDKDPPDHEDLSGMVCYITVSGFLNGAGFQKMRDDLRRSCDDIWIIDCSPEGHQPEVATRIFQGVQHPVCIVLASRSPANDPDKPARVRFRALAKGRREEKFAALETVRLDGKGWSDCPSDWRAPFLPAFSGGWADFVPLDSVIGDCGSGVMPGRTWIIAPDKDSLQRRWQRLVEETDASKQAMLFHPHMRGGNPGDRHVGKSGRALDRSQIVLTPIDRIPVERTNPDKKLRALAERALAGEPPIAYAFRSFDRQYIIPDARVINQPNPGLWDNFGKDQVYLTAPMDRSPTGGPAISAASIIPDLHHYNGRGGRVFALWKDAAATQSNISAMTLAALAKAFGARVDPVDVFAYVAALLACPAYTEKFKGDLIRPGLRVPITADATLFAEAAVLGREIVWLHSFGVRFADGRPAGAPRLPEGRKPDYPKAGAISNKPEDFPDTIDYDAAKQRLLIGTGYIDRVPPAVWAYEVSGKQVLRQWFSYRKKDRERPQIGDKRKPSPLGDIQPDHWLPEYTSELINVLNVLGMLVDLEPKQADLLNRICDGPLIPASKIA